MSLSKLTRQMGASEWKVFYHVTLPMTWRQVVSAYMLGFARALGEFGATLMFAGSIAGLTRTIPTSIYIAVESGNVLLAYYWVFSIILFAFVLLSVVQRFKKWIVIRSRLFIDIHSINGTVREELKV